MKKMLLLILLVSSAMATTFDLNGTFENSKGCRVYGALCYNYQSNTCRFEVYLDGEYAGAIGKGGKAEFSDEDDSISVKDKGLRSTMLGIPGIVNRSATLTNLEGYKDQGSYTDVSITGFDLEFKGGLLSKKIECKNLRFVEE